MRTQVDAPPLGPGGPRLRDARRLVRWIARWRPLRVVADDAASFPHHWQISGAWDGELKRWELHLVPGWVNGEEVLSPPMAIDQLPQITLDRLKQAGDLPAKALSARARARLSDHPAIPITEWRAVGTDADPLREVEEVPAYFLERGVVPPDPVSTANQTLTFSELGAPEQRAKRRLLRCVDVILNVPRPVARLEILDDGRPAVAIEPASGEATLSVQAERYDPAAESASIQESLAGVLDDDGIERLLIGRLWLLSPAGAAEGSDPNQSWTPEGQNEVFYSLDFDVDRDIDVIEPFEYQPPATGLAGGVTTVTVSGIIADARANDAIAAALLSRAKIVGAFRTV